MSCIISVFKKLDLSIISIYFLYWIALRIYFTLSFFFLPWISQTLWNKTICTIWIKWACFNSKLMNLIKFELIKKSQEKIFSYFLLIFHPLSSHICSQCLLLFTFWYALNGKWSWEVVAQAFICWRQSRHSISKQTLIVCDCTLLPTNLLEKHFYAEWY